MMMRSGSTRKRSPDMTSTPTLNARIDDLTTQATKAAKDALYIGVGFGVLAFQQAQTRRHELAATLEKNGLPTVRKGLEAGRAQLEKLSDALDRPLTGLDDGVVAVEAKVDAVLDTVQARLPDPAATALGQLRATAKVATNQVRDRVRTSA
jgi:hypothetical protein